LRNLGITNISVVSVEQKKEEALKDPDIIEVKVANEFICID